MFENVVFTLLCLPLKPIKIYFTGGCKAQGPNEYRQKEIGSF